MADKSRFVWREGDFEEVDAEDITDPKIKARLDALAKDTKKKPKRPAPTKKGD